MTPNDIKVYIGLITTKCNAQYLEWYNDASKYIDGLAVTWHGDRDKGFDILDKNKGSGFISEIEYYGHHGHSMNHWLLNPKIRPGSYFIIRDTLEQCSLNWLKTIREFCFELQKQGINSVYQYSKLLIFRKFEHQFFTNTPHWALQGARDHKVAIELWKNFENPKDYAFSVRNDIRPKHHSIKHFGVYYLLDSSNHMWLGREGKNDETLVHERVRYKFKEYLENVCKIPLTVDDLLDYWKKTPLNYEMKWFIQFEPILLNLYRYYILNHNLDDVLNQKPENYQLP